jgi:toxin FitB
MYLLDTNVLSELHREKPDAVPLAWFENLGANEAFVSVLTIGELVKGAERIKDSRPVLYGSLVAWIEDLEEAYRERTLAITLPISRRYGFLARSKAVERECGQIDILLAATAIEHGLTVVTRNVAHFEKLQADVVNPWLPSGPDEPEPELPSGSG